MAVGASLLVVVVHVVVGATMVVVVHVLVGDIH